MLARHHRHLHPILLGVVITSLVSLLTLAPFLGAPKSAAAAAACPATKSHLVPWKGGRWYLSGVNVPSQSGGFGADFATVEEWGQHTYSHATTESMFAALKAKGVNSVRWFVFLDGRGAPEFNATSGGAVTGLDANTLPTMADAAQLASQYNIHIVFTLWSFEMLFPDSTSSARGEHSGGHRDLIVDATKRQSFIDKALVPMLGYQVPGTSYTLGTHPNVLGWDIMNEPEWGVSDLGAVNSSITQPVSLAELQRFVASIAGAIHRNSNQLVTVGSAAMKWSSSTAPGSTGNVWKDAALTPYDAQGYLDFYQAHYYGWMNGDGVNWSYSPLQVSWQAAGYDKPVVIGEHPADASNAGVSATDMLNGFHNNCYGGAWAWSYEPVDASGSWNNISTAIGQFDSANAGEVNISGSGTTPTMTPAPSTATPTKTPAPSTATPAAGAEKLIFADTLAAGWANWSWNTKVVLNYSAIKQSGKLSIAATHQQQWAGLRFHTDKPLATAGLKKVRFWVHGGTTGGQSLMVYIENGRGQTSPQARIASPKANTWTLVEVSLASLGNPDQISDLAIQEAGGTINRTFYVDQISVAP